MFRTSLLLPAAGLVATVTLALGAGTAGATATPPPASAATGRATFIVTLRPGVDVADTAGELRGRGAEVVHVYRSALSGFAGRLGPDLADALRRDGRVERIERDTAVQASGSQASPTWGLDRIDQVNRPFSSSYTYDQTGAGVNVYVIDSGVRASHTDLSGRVVAGYTAINDGRGTSDCNGHGTHVAGTVGGTTYGVAKRATIVPVRVLDCNGSGTASGVIAGIDWVSAHHAAGAPAVANMSLGGGTSTALDAAVRSSIADGVTYVVAAGNENVDACTKSPARVGEALTVAATTSSDARAWYSNGGPCVDLFGPGSSITSTSNTSDTATATSSGTSMAAPHVAGIAALRLSAAPSASPATVSWTVVGGASANVVSDVAGAPNRLAYSRLTAVATAPSAPTAPTASGTSRAVTVAWKAPVSGGSPITSYDIRIRRASDGTLVKTSRVSASTLKTSVGGLTAGTAYRATVRASNAVGSSAWSAASNVTSALL